VNCLESERVNSLKVTILSLDFHVRINSSALWRNFSDEIGRAGFLVLIWKNCLSSTKLDVAFH
jgi:hypothetical protein